MDTFDKLCTSIENAETLEALDSLTAKMESLELSKREKGFAERLLKVAQEKEEIKREMMGKYFTDALEVWKIKHEELPKEDKRMDSFYVICRDATPEDYLHIKEAAETRNKNGNLYDPYLDTLGTNSAYPKSDRDIFNKPIDNSKAHVFLDSKSCAPAWGLAAEGATGKIDEKFTNQEKNKIRLLRMMGPKSKEKTHCLRRDVHNYFPIAASHRKYYDGEPQLLIIPILPLDEIKSRDFNTPYDVLVVVASKGKGGGLTAAEIYRHILSNFDWDQFNQNWDEFGKNPAVCEPQEIEMAFTGLREFIKALAHTCVLNTPQDLVKLARGQDDINCKSNKKNNTTKTKAKKNKKNERNLRSVVEDELMEPTGDGGASANEEKVWWDYEPLQEIFKRDGVGLPFMKTGDIGHVLKVRFDAGNAAQAPLPDPWVLMVKAAVNYSYIVYGYKLLPSCKPPPHESVLQYEEALRLHERRVRQQDIPLTLSVPTSPVTNPGMSESRVVTPADKEKEIEESNSWEYFED